MPSEQGFNSYQVTIPINLRLVQKEKFMTLQRTVEVIPQTDMRCQLGLQIHIKEAMAISSISLRMGHRHIRLHHQNLGGEGVIPENNNAETGKAMKLLSGKIKLLLKRFQNLCHNYICMLGRSICISPCVFEHDNKLIAAETGDCIFSSHDFL